MAFFQNIFTPKNNVDDLGKSIQMSISFTSVFERGVMQQCIADRSELTGETKGAVAANILKNALISAEGNDALAYQSCLYDAVRKAPIDQYPEKVGILSSLESVFCDLSNGVDFAPKHPKGLPYVVFAEEMARENGLVLHEHISSGPDPRINLKRDFDEIKRLLDKNDHAIEPSILAIIESDNRPLVQPVLSMVLNNWDILSDTQLIYKFLMYLMASTDNWQDTPLQRNRFRDVCSLVSSERLAWQERQFQNKRKSSDSIMTNISITNGDSVDIPNTWIQLAPQLAKDCSYVGVIEVKNSGFDGAPHFVFFSDKQIYELNDEEKEALLLLAQNEWAPLADVLNKRVKLKYGPDGGILNYAEYLKSPMVGFFPIPESSEVNSLNPAPYGAVICRSGSYSGA